MMHSITALKKNICEWAAKQNDISAVALVGSWTRTKGKETSDIDLILIVSNPSNYIAADYWVTEFGAAEKIIHETWGLLQTKRVFFKTGQEIEFNFTTSDWSNTRPVDSGTQKVVQEGMQILYDKDNLLHDLKDAIDVFDRKK